MITGLTRYLRRPLTRREREAIHIVTVILRETAKTAREEELEALEEIDAINRQLDQLKQRRFAIDWLEASEEVAARW